MFDAASTLAQAVAKVTKNAQRIQDRMPYRTIGGVYDDWSESEPSWWTNGFWPGLLWLTWRETKNPDLARWAEGVEVRFDRVLEDYEGLYHDVGFQWYLSSGAHHRLVGNPTSRRRCLHAANLLAGRFNLAGRFIRAWNDDKIGWAIIDCLMNLPLLYWASRETGDPRFRQVAEAHTETVLKHFLYPDGSTKHIVEFNPHSGAYVTNHGGQGYDAQGAWSRGNAWALYGLALGARDSGRSDFLAAAEKVAGFFLGHLPADQVPGCDFRTPEGLPNPKDSSAAAIAASGLLLLAQLVPDEVLKKRYTEGATAIVASLAAHYTDAADEALLVHGCTAYHETKPGWRDTSLIYGDYFYVEALGRLQGKEGLF